MIITGFPAYRYDRAVSVLGMTHAKHVRAAAREGWPAPAAPTLTIARRYLMAVCNSCHERVEATPGEVFADGTCAACGKGVMSKRNVLDLDLTCERPVVDGWEFLAVVEPIVGGNLIRQVPGADVGTFELAGYRNAKIACDHCKTARDRKETFIARKASAVDVDGEPSHRLETTSTYRMVGRSCLAGFLPGKPLDWIIASVGLAESATGRATGESDGAFWLGGDPVWEPAEVLRWTAAIVRLDGWTPKSKATEQTPATATIVCEILSAPRHGTAAYTSWQRARAHYAPNSADQAYATEASAWISRQAGVDLSDYLYSVSTVAKQPIVEASKLGILCSLIAAYGNAIGASMKQRDAGVAPADAHVGEVGTRITIAGIALERVITLEGGEYGPLYLHAFRDTEGRAIVWITGKTHGRAGDVFTMTATIAEHGNFRGAAQTKVSRAKLVQENLVEKDAP